MLIERKGSVKLLKTGKKTCFSMFWLPALSAPPISISPSALPSSISPQHLRQSATYIAHLDPPPFQVLFSQAKKSVVSRPFSFGIVFCFKISWIINCPTLCPFVFDSLPTPLFCLLVFFFFSTFCLIWYLIYLLTLAISSSSLFNKHENPISGRRTVWKPIPNLRFSVFAFLSKILRC